ncbi:MAG: DUF2291 domain-containing protein [Anaerovibrio sp.]|jgi:predicted lipoprotein|uniref:DUF2291 domain-containing protein n=1 Tax=Anaerovibrio sp. TaxID=1872532 RepID=UPI0025BFA511|nr:DUF2291 domain-containing protein [Anaerovibrio sp.]MBE6099717.1 DUF2291 domain-containing protein [Anaerovibrio sp.]
MKKRIGLIIMLCLVMVISLTGCVKVVQIGHEDEVTGAKKFDAASSVEAIWQSQAVPELKEKAVEMPKLLTEANGTLKAVASKYGKYSMGDSGELSFIVKGKGQITEVNTEKKAGYMIVQLEGYSGPMVTKLQIGPVFKGSAVRDCLSFIKYEDYTNQVDWAKISQSIHDVVAKDVIQPANVSSLQGKTVEFTGCFTVDKPDEMLVTPVELIVK